MKEQLLQPSQKKCRETILVVEDDPIISFALSSRLQEDGFKIIQAGTADEALQIGWVQSVVQAENLLGETEAMVREILAQSPIAVKLTWEALHRGLNMTLEESALLGADYFGLAASTDDFRAGSKAFLEKTTPSFTGR